MTIVSRGNRRGKGFDQETHYITYLFSGLVSNIKINLFFRESVPILLSS